MMKFILLSAVFGIALAQRGRLTVQQPRNTNEIQTLRLENENRGDNSFRYAYETSDGSKAESSGYIRNPNEPDQEKRSQVVEGSYQYYTPEGQLVSISYKADENGYSAQGDAIPTSPPVPVEIQKALDIIYRNAAAQTQRASQQPPRRF